MGINFGAGMTGGLAWVLDEDQNLLSQCRYHDEFLWGTPFAEADEDQQNALRSLIEEHVELAHSSLGKRLLAGWAAASTNFVLFTPKPQA